MNRNDTAPKRQVISAKAMLYTFDLEERANKKESNPELDAKLKERKTAKSKFAQLKELQAEIEKLVSRNTKTLCKVVELQDALIEVQMTIADADEGR